MITLAIDTSTPLGGICLYSREKGILGEMRLGVIRTHSESILPGIDFLLRTSRLKIDEIDFLTVTIGPGSFTGLRVGLGTAKGLAFATGMKVVAVSSLRAFAYSMAQEGYLLCPLIDARKKEVYAAGYRKRGDDLEEVVPEGAYVIEEFLDRVEAPVLFAGTGAELYRERIVRKIRDGLFATDALNSIIPASLAEYGLREAERGNYAEPDTLVPRYLRRSEAEIKFGKL